MTTSQAIDGVVRELLGDSPPIRIITPDGRSSGPTDAPATVIIRSDDALRHLVRAPGELGFARAYVSGALDIEGDIFAVVGLHDRLPDLRRQPALVARLARLAGRAVIEGPAPIPPEEVDLGSTWLAHTRHRDAASISHHYDVSNEFYSLVLGPSWTYSCAVFASPEDDLERAQRNKHDLIAKKLGLRPGMRFLDVGCGWGSMVIHAAEHYGVRAVGVTISENQAELAEHRVKEAGLEDRVEIRLQDYRDIPASTFDAISSIGMFEHVGFDQLREYFSILWSKLPAGGRLLNHQIGRAPELGTRPRFRHERTRVHPRGFVHRYVFPDGELHEVGDLVGAMQRTGFEVRHVESLREHYDTTLQRWVANLDANWDRAVELTSEGRARVWRLYMAASALQFRTNQVQVHQILAVKPSADGASAMPLRPSW